jgi:hypothetical protein
MTSYPTRNLILNAIADADLSSSQYRAVVLTATGTAALAGAGDAAIGFLLNTPIAGQVCEIATVGGGAKGVSAATLNAGVPVKSDANGELVAAVSTDLAVATTLEASIAGDVVPLLVERYTVA